MLSSIQADDLVQWVPCATRECNHFRHLDIFKYDNIIIAPYFWIKKFQAWKSLRMSQIWNIDRIGVDKRYGRDLFSARCYDIVNVLFWEIILKVCLIFPSYFRYSLYIVYYVFSNKSILCKNEKNKVFFYALWLQ